MSKTSKNILGDQRGKIGKVVGRVVNGIQTYSAYNEHQSDRKSPKQLAARARFKAVMQLVKPMNGVINIGLRLAASHLPMTSPSNVFSKRNNRLMIYDAESGVATPDYENLILSDGHTPYVNFGEAAFDGPHSVKVTFTSPLDASFGAYDADSVYIAVLCPDMEECCLVKANRFEAFVTATVSPLWTDKTVHVWGFVMTSVDETLLVEAVGLRLHPGECSSTVYIGTGVIA